MIRGLTLVALGGAAVAILAISASGGAQHRSWHVPGFVWNMGDDDDGDSGSVRLNGGEKTITKDIPWQGSESLTFDLPAHVVYTQGPIAKLSITGPDTLVNHTVIEGDTLKLDRSISNMSIEHALTIAITAPALHDFKIDAALKLELRNLSTDELSIELDGAGKVNADGAAKSLKLQINGAGDADFSPMTLTDAKIEIDGLGHVIAGPTGNADVQINGAGKVTLTKRPAHLTEDINGAGSVTQPDAPAGTNL